MSKDETYLDILDAMPVGHKSFIPKKEGYTDKSIAQSYRNNASYLKKLKQKHFVVKKINDSYIVMRMA